MTSSYADVAKPKSKTSEPAVDVPLEGEFDPARWEKDVYLSIRSAHLVKHELSAEAPGIFDSETALHNDVLEAVDGLLGGYPTEYPTPPAKKLANAVACLMWRKAQEVAAKRKK